MESQIIPHWLVVEPPTPLKNDGVSSSAGMTFHSQLFLESHSKFHGSSHHQPDGIWHHGHVVNRLSDENTR